MHEFELIKIWRVFDWLPDDVMWLQENNYAFRVATTNIPIAQGNKITYMRGDVGVRVETRTEQQELLLKLKFEPGLVLLLQEHVLPGSTVLDSVGV